MRAKHKAAKHIDFDNKSAPEFRPSPELLEEARKTSMLYTMTLEEDEEGRGWTGASVELPGCFASGNTHAECVEKLKFYLTLSVAHLMQSKQPVPRPCRDELRDQQVNVRLTAKEKLYLDTMARSEGFRSASDLMRLAVLSYLGNGKSGHSKA